MGENMYIGVYRCRLGIEKIIGNQASKPKLKGIFERDFDDLEYSTPSPCRPYWLLPGIQQKYPRLRVHGKGKPY